MAEKYTHSGDGTCSRGPDPEKFEPEIGRNLCRVEKGSYSTREYMREKVKYGGYRVDILTENLTERDKAVLICKICQGVMKEASLSSSGEQFCLCCKKENSKETPNLSVREIVDSLKCSCPLIVRGCKWLGTLEDCENHLDTCGYVYETCKLRCGAVLGRDRLRTHEKEKCPQRVVTCNHCKEAIKSCELNEHLDKCPKIEVSCGLCNMAMCREEMKRHLKADCGMVQEICGLGCGVKLTRDELKTHEKDTCVKRRKQCEHCYQSIYLTDIQSHLADYCLDKVIECPFVEYKCLERIKRKDIDKHLEEKQTKHLELKLTAMEDLITKQSEEINQLKEIIRKQSKVINNQTETIELISEQSKGVYNQKEEIRMKIAETSRQIELLYFVTDTTRVVTQVKFPNQTHSHHEVAGYKFAIKFLSNREMRIVFQGTGKKHDRPFIAKCQIVFLSRLTINCGIIEVKQKDLTRGCERVITTLSEEDIEKYSQQKSPHYAEKDLTLEVYFTKLV